MALTFPAATCKVLCDALVDLCESGTPPATLEIGNAGWAKTLAVFTLANPAFGAATSAAPAVATAAAIADVTAADTGTASVFRVKNGSGTVLWSGTVGVSAADLIIDNASIVTGQTVKIVSWTHSQPGA